MLINCCQFPVVAETPVPFYKHPYKMFALTPLTFLFWRTMQIMIHEKFGPHEGYALGLLNICVFIIPALHNTTCLVLRDNYAHRLGGGVVGTQGILLFNVVDTLNPEIIDNHFGKDALIVRVAIVAISVLCSISLICYANGDRPYRHVVEANA